MPLGRLSTAAARLLIGKDKPTITAHVDVGDFVIVINSDDLIVTGKKTAAKTYYRHSGFPGGLYKRTVNDQTKLDSTKIVRHAIRGMLPDNKLRQARLGRLKIYVGSDHQHLAQTPQKYKSKESQ